MSKFKVVDSASTYLTDSTVFAATAAPTSLTLLAAGTLSLAGVSSVVGSSGADGIILLGALTAAQALTKFGSSTAISAVATFNYDTKNTLAATVDTLTGAAAAETINLTNTGTSGLVNIKYSSGSITTGDTLVGTTAAVDTITLTAASKITYRSASTAAATDIITGSGSADNITLTDGIVDGASPGVIADAFWNFKSGGGIDSVTGDDGVDKITLSAASSLIYNSGGGADTITGSSGNDLIKLGTGFGAAQAFIYATGGGTDSIVGTTAADTITIGGASAVSLKYSSGNMTADTLTLSSAADTVTLAAASNVSISGGGADQIAGSSSSDIITMAAASTGATIQGNGGADLLTASTTAAGVDTFAYASKADSGTTSTTRDTILNFNAGTGVGDADVDILKFTAMRMGTFALLPGDRATDTSTTAVAEWSGAGNSQARFYDTGIYSYTDAAGVSQTTTGLANGGGGLLEVDVDGNGTTDMSILLVGVSQSNLNAGDFSWT